MSRGGKLLLIGVIALLLVGAVGGGAAWKVHHDNIVAAQQLADAKAKAKAKAAAEAKAKAAAEAKAKAEAISSCRQQLRGLDNALTDLSSRLNSGLNYNDYGTRVGDAQSAYGRTNIQGLSVSCGTNAGVPLENAMNDYTSAARAWNTCFADIDCSTDSIDGELQSNWTHAESQLQDAHAGYSQVTPGGTSGGDNGGGTLGGGGGAS